MPSAANGEFNLASRNLLLERQYGKDNFKKKTVEEADNIPELIMQYKKLLDEKLITQEEFDTKKKELLNI